MYKTYTKAAIGSILILLGMIGVQAQDFYRQGTLPPGPVYTETDLGNMAGTKFDRPAYLKGRFVYLGKIKGIDLFSTFTEQGEMIEFGKTIIAVNFLGNFPGELKVGKIIVSTDENPLTLKSIARSGNALIVIAEDRSTE